MRMFAVYGFGVISGLILAMILFVLFHDDG